MGTTQCLFVSLLMAVFAYDVETGFSERRIIGGNSVKNRGRFPYQASLQYLPSGHHFCGGTVIASRWILTAAHCFFEKNEKHTDLNTVEIVLGITNLTDEGNRYRPREVFIHHLYRKAKTSYGYDIALAKTTTLIEFNSYVQPIPICRQNIPDHVTLMITGWGRIETFQVKDNHELKVKGKVPNTLQYAKVTLMSFETCKRHHRSSKLDRLCTSTLHGIVACNGDSGGPLVYSEYDDFCVAGIISYGKSKTCSAGKPDIATNVPYYANWIDNIMAGNYNKAVVIHCHEHKKRVSRWIDLARQILHYLYPNLVYYFV